MAVLEIVKIPDERLRVKALPVEEFNSSLRKLLDDMRDTLYEADGVGLAAPQVGVSLRVAIIDVSKNGSGLIELINPEIISSSGKIKSEEGCLSIPGYRDTIDRSALVTVRAQDREGKEFVVDGSGLLARAIQHEIDHLDGILFVDHLSQLKKELFKRWLKKQL